MGLGTVCCPLPEAANEVNARNADAIRRWRRVVLSCMVTLRCGTAKWDWDCPEGNLTLMAK
jgi:hypothetical protein